MNYQTHRSSPEVLNRRTLERDHRRLAHYLRPGAAVLDVGCGSGAITAGIARRVGPDGVVVGVDRDDALLTIASQQYQDIANLSFRSADATALPFIARFDVVTAARTLQWVGDPNLALRMMTRAARPHARVVVLDYNHEDNAWTPQPPQEFRRFYTAFLAWRAANQWDNRIADHLPAMFHATGLEEIQRHVDDEVAHRGDPDFASIVSLWLHVIESVGPRIVAAGFLKEQERFAAEDCYAAFAAGTLATQTLAMRTVVGRVPDRA